MRVGEEGGRAGGRAAVPALPAIVADPHGEKISPGPSRNHQQGSLAGFCESGSFYVEHMSINDRHRACVVSCFVTLWE